MAAHQLCDISSLVVFLDDLHHNIEHSADIYSSLDSFTSVINGVDASVLGPSGNALTAALNRLSAAMRAAGTPAECPTTDAARVISEIENVRAIIQLHAQDAAPSDQMLTDSGDPTADEVHVSEEPQLEAATCSDDGQADETDDDVNDQESVPADCAKGPLSADAEHADEDEAADGVALEEAPADRSHAAPPPEDHIAADDPMAEEVVSADLDAPPPAGDPELLGEGDQAPEAQDWGSQLIEFDEERAELLQFMVADVRNCVGEIEPIVAEARDYTSRQDAADRLVGLADQMSKMSEFFAFRSFEMILGVLREIGHGLGTVGDGQLDELCMRVRALGGLLDQYCSRLEVGMELTWPLDTMRRRIALLLEGRSLHPDLVAWHRSDPDRILELDGVMESIEALPSPETEHVSAASATVANASADTRAPDSAAASIRISRPSFEAMFDIARQLVLNKNQIEGVAEALMPDGLSRAETEQLGLRVAELSRLVKRLQEVLNATSVQPLSAVLDRYKRMLLDVAHIKDKEIDFRVEGADIAIDKFVLDAIADPIGRLLRDIVSRSIETTQERSDAGKPEAGLVRIEAEDHQSHITISILHDGRPRDVELIRTEAAGSDTAPAEIDQLSDDEVKLLPLASWYPTGDTTGVMEAFLSQRASIRVHSRDGLEATTIVLPLAGAVIGAMTVRVGSGVYAIPVRAIKEIVAVAANAVQSLGGEPVIRLRESIYPLARCGEIFGDSTRHEPRFAVIADADGTSAALGVDQVLGHQEIVIEPLGLPDDATGPFLGAAIRGDGDVCLVIDVRRLLSEHTGTQHHAAAA